MQVSSNHVFTLLLGLLMLSCGTPPPANETEEAATEEVTETAPNTLTAAEAAEGWELLFDGKTFAGWTGYNRDTIGSSWRIEEDALHLYADLKEDWAWKPSDGGWIVTEGTYENFELQLEWKITPCGNSGIIYKAAMNADYSEPWLTGPEMQVLDDSCHPDGKIISHRAGDLYDMIAGDSTALKPAGEWNHARIVCNGEHLEHWLNGVKMVETTIHTPEWDAMIAASKFGPEGTNPSPDFGQIRRGHICLQDHNDAKVWYRNIKLKNL